jgi:hypothetical protein
MTELAAETVHHRQQSTQTKKKVRQQVVSHMDERTGLFWEESASFTLSQ